MPDDGGDFDLVLIGSGASASFTLLHVLEALEGSPIGASIAVIEKDGEFHRGIAYGRRSSRWALTITALDEFLPPGERETFLAWCGERGGEAAAHEDASPPPIEHPIRRRLFGDYLAERVERAMRDAGRRGEATVTLVHGEALDLRARDDGGYVLAWRAPEERPTEARGRDPGHASGDGPDGGPDRDPDGGPDGGRDDAGATRTLGARRAVLCIGGLPTRRLERAPARAGRPPDASPEHGWRVVDAIYGGDYDRRLGALVERIETGFAGGAEVPRLLVVGSNASAMELLYALQLRRASGERRVAVTVVSPLGTLPELARAGAGHRPLPADAWLGPREGASPFSAEALFESIEALIRDARADGLALVDYNPAANRYLLTELGRMEHDELLRFIRRYANRLGRYKRFAECEYLDAADALGRDGALEILSGSVRSLDECPDGVDVTFERDGQRWRRRFDGVLNCGGAEALDERTTIPLVRNLVARRLATHEAGQVGFEVDEGFRVAEDLHVMGPLISGNIIDDKPVWHMEHCGRIIQFSRLLATVLTDSMKGTRLR